MSFRDILRKYTPSLLLKYYRNFKKNRTRKKIMTQREKGMVWKSNDLKRQLKAIGIDKGDTLLVHSSLSKMGFVENGPNTVIEALLETVGSQGHVLMPNSPNASFQLEYIQELNCFDVEKDKSRLGVITEVFRNHPEAKRSCHPTEPVSCIGPDQEYFVGHHFGEETPYTKNSPFFRVAESNGKILMIGVTLDNAGTNLHTLEDAIPNFKYPVYYPKRFEVDVKLPDGSRKSMKTRVHDPKWSKKRNCDDLIPLFKKYGALEHVKIGSADTLLLDARKMFNVMIDLYNEYGVTMYDLGEYTEDL